MKRESWSRLEWLLVFAHTHGAGEAGGSLRFAGPFGARFGYWVAIFIERPGLIKATRSLMGEWMNG